MDYSLVAVEIRMVVDPKDHDLSSDTLKSCGVAKLVSILEKFMEDFLGRFG